MEKYKQNRILTTCKCDNCGTEFQKPLSEYTRNQKLGRHNFCSRSCAGKFRQSLNIPLTQAQLDNQRAISKHSGNRKDMYTPFRETLHRTKRRFKEVNITLQDLKEQWEKQNGRCAYTNLPIILPIGNSHPDIRYQASLDRIDSNLGYIRGNIQFVATPINYMKSTMSDKVFREYLKEITSAFTEDQTISSPSLEGQDALAGN